jgi:hypothetical protein
MGSLVKYLKTLIILSVLLIIPCIAKSELIETWECVEPNGTEILFIAQVNEREKTGQIKVTSTTHDAFVHVGDFFRRWDFGLNENGTMYRYSLVIKQDGKGLYFDFSQGYTVEPSQRLKCKNL